MYTLSRSQSFKKWIRKLKDEKAKALILLRLKRVEKGNFGDHSYLADKIWELGFDTGPGYRAYYTIQGSEIVLLICGGNKGSQNRDIRKAKLILAELEKKNEREV